MSDHEEHGAPSQLPPSDTERVQVLARLIHRRISELTTQEGISGFLSAADRRELYVLAQLRDQWLHETSD